MITASWQDIGIDGSSRWMIALALLGLLMIIPAWTDLFRARLVPSIFTYPLIIGAGALIWQLPPEHRINNILAGISIALVYGLVAWAGQMGWGDYKLMIPAALLCGANFLMFLVASFALLVPVRFVMRRQIHEAKKHGEKKLDLMPAFGPPIVLGAQIVWALMGVPVWVVLLWVGGWLVAIAVGVYEQRSGAALLPARVRAMAAEGKTGDVYDIAGKQAGYLERQALLQGLLDSDHWQELWTVKRTIQPLEGSDLIVELGERLRPAFTLVTASEEVAATS